MRETLNFFNLITFFSKSLSFSLLSWHVSRNNQKANWLLSPLSLVVFDLKLKSLSCTKLVHIRKEVDLIVSNNPFFSFVKIEAVEVLNSFLKGISLSKLGVEQTNSV